jgi:hypothetical protein
MPHFNAARARWGVHWHMIGAQKSLVEILLLEFPQFRLKLVLQSHREFRRKPDKLPPTLRTSSNSKPILAGVDIASEISLAMSRCSLTELIVASTLSMLLGKKKGIKVGISHENVHVCVRAGATHSPLWMSLSALAPLRITSSVLALMFADSNVLTCTSSCNRIPASLSRSASCIFFRLSAAVAANYQKSKEKELHAIQSSHQLRLLARRKGKVKERRTVLVGDGIGFRRRKVLCYLSLKVLLLLLDHHELLAQGDDCIACGLLGIASSGEVAHKRSHHDEYEMV